MAQEMPCRQRHPWRHDRVVHEYELSRVKMPAMCCLSGMHVWQVSNAAWGRVL